MRKPTIFLLLLATLVSCESALISNQAESGGLFSSQQGTSLNIMSTTPNDPLYDQQDYLNAINVPQAWQATNGSGNKEIAIIALGGINDNHEDLQSRITIKTSASSPSANNGAATPLAGIIGAATNNGKGIAGVNWVSPILSYNIAKKSTKEVKTLPIGRTITTPFVDLNRSSVAPAINGAVSAGAETILLPLNWMLEDKAKELNISGLQFYPCCKIQHPYQLIYKVGKHLFNAIVSAFKTNSNYTSAIDAVKNAYLNGAVVVGGALQYDGIAIGFPANLASDHVVFTVGAANLSNEPFQYSGIPESDVVSYDSDDINIIAPGVNILTTLPPASNQKYGKVRGTHTSAALATGIISLLQAAENDLTPDDIAHILEKTAVPVGGPGYDHKSGYGLIDAGAAMNYVQTYDIKHGTTKDAQIEKIANDRQITLYSSVWEKLASGVYFADIYKVTYTIPLIPSASNDLWYNAKGTYGWSYANPNSQNRYANVELFNDHATITTYIYDLYNSAGQKVGWHPVSPNNVQLRYSYVGQIATPPLSVTISGPSDVDKGETQYFDSSVQNEESSVSYQWYFRTHPNGEWIEDSGATGPSYTHLFDYPDGTTMYKNQAVRIVIHNNGETASDVHSVEVIDCDEEKYSGVQLMAPCR